MSLEDQLMKHVRQYLASKTSFDDLASWVQGHELHWETLAMGSPSRRLASRIMLMAYEVWDGKRFEASAREVIREQATTASSPRT
jgi:hypothetical protein